MSTQDDAWIAKLEWFISVFFAQAGVAIPSPTPPGTGSPVNGWTTARQAGSDRPANEDTDRAGVALVPTPGLPPRCSQRCEECLAFAPHNESAEGGVNARHHGRASCPCAQATVMANEKLFGALKHHRAILPASLTARVGALLGVVNLATTALRAPGGAGNAIAVNAAERGALMYLLVGMQYALNPAPGGGLAPAGLGTVWGARCDSVPLHYTLVAWRNVAQTAWTKYATDGSVSLGAFTVPPKLTPGGLAASTTSPTTWLFKGIADHISDHAAEAALNGSAP